MKAIQVRFLPATNFKGARMKAWTEGNNQIIIPYQYEISTDKLRVELTAMELLIKMKWDNIEINGIGQLSNGDYCVTLKNK